MLLGEHDYYSTTEATSYRADVCEIRQHPDYLMRADSTPVYDFSLLRLTSPINFTSWPNVRPVCLPGLGDHQTYADHVATVTGINMASSSCHGHPGWGTLISGGSPFYKLREVEMKVVSSYSYVTYL